MGVKGIWNIRQPDPSRVAELSQKLNVSNVVSGLLVNRGYDDPESAQTFLNPRLSQLASPHQIKGMPEAVTRILAAFEQGERVTIHGDYDVDGMTASTILTRFLRKIGYEPHVFLPNRFVDGYGVNPKRVEALVADGTSLFISVDCGIRDVAAVAKARELGADFIIVDHHQLPNEGLPNANAILNPHQPDCPFPFKDLCAAGLAFYLVLGLRAELRSRGVFADQPEPDVRDLLDITALGTIADVVPLRGLNRILTTYGLERMRQSPYVGIRALLSLLPPGRPLTAGTVGFQMVPRLNAAGRLSDPFKGFELLSTDDANIAKAIAKEIDRENKERRELQDVIEEQAVAQVMESPKGVKAPAHVLWSEQWHPGVTGIVASRSVERFHRPCVMIAINDEGIGKGSIRSIRGFDVMRGLQRCEEWLEQYGGHPYAAGLSIRAENIEKFRDAFQEAAQALTPPDAWNPSLSLDAEVSFEDISSNLIDTIEVLAPFGAGNPEPKFCSRRVRVGSVRRVGADGDHAKLALTQDERRMDAIAFRVGDEAPEEGALIDVAFRPEYNEWRGKVSVQLRIVDWEPSA